MSTRIFDVVDGLLSTFRAASGFCAPGGVGVEVFDGVQEIGSEPSTYVVVGGVSLLADEDADELAASSDAVWRTVPVQAGSQTESVTVPCVASVWTGDGNGAPDFAALRSDLSVVMSGLESATRTVAGLGLDGQHTVTFARFTLRQAFTMDGAFASCEFDVEVTLSK